MFLFHFSAKWWDWKELPASLQRIQLIVKESHLSSSANYHHLRLLTWIVWHLLIKLHSKQTKSGDSWWPQCVLLSPVVLLSHLIPSLSHFHWHCETDSSTSIKLHHGFLSVHGNFHYVALTKTGLYFKCIKCNLTSLSKYLYCWCHRLLCANHHDHRGECNREDERDFSELKKTLNTETFWSIGPSSTVCLVLTKCATNFLSADSSYDRALCL